MTTTGTSTSTQQEEGEVVGVKVVVRVRKMLPHETLEGCKSCVFVEENTPVPQQLMVLDKPFSFDHTFGPEVDQATVYERAALPMLDKWFQGFNACIFAYGQTGSGKTFSMGNTLEGISSTFCDASSGIIPRLLRDIFALIDKEKEKEKAGLTAPEEEQEEEVRLEYRLQLSYLEIYKEECVDLLAATTPSSQQQAQAQNLTIREDGNGITVAGLTTHDAASMQAVADLLYRGALARSTAATNMNNNSSRSHAIVTLYLESWPAAASVLEGTDTHTQAEAPRRLSKFHLVDLAGSERQKRTKAEGDRFKEGVQINKGLLALGNVISALTEPGGPRGHIPYRDAKITRLLQDSLGGSSYTCMIACVSPADSNADESINTLRYASRARSIQNVATQNFASSLSGADMSVEVTSLKKEVRYLQMQLASARSTAAGGASVGGGGGGGGLNNEVVAVLREENRRLRESLQKLEGQAKGATEEALMQTFRLECLMMRYQQLESVAKEGGVEVPAGLSSEEQFGSPAGAAAAAGMDLGAGAGGGGGGSLFSAAKAAALAAAASGGGGEEDDEKMAVASAAAAMLMEEEGGEGGGQGQCNGDDDEGVEEARELVAGEVANLDVLIRRKEEAMASLSKEKRCFGQLRTFFEGTIERLQQEVQALQGERDQLATALTKTQATGKAADPSMVATMRARERELEKKVRELQQKEAQHRRIMAMKQKAEEETRKLKLEIEEAKRRQGELLRKTRQEASRLCKERREKELEAVRLRRNESKIKCDYEKTLQSYVRQEAVLRRKIAEVSAASQRQQEIIRRLTEGARSNPHHKNKGEGFRQRERAKELRRFVQTEMEACGALVAKKMALQELLDQRAAVAAAGASGAAGAGREAAGQEEREKTTVVEALSVAIQKAQKELMEMESDMQGGSLGLGLLGLAAGTGTTGGRQATHSSSSGGGGTPGTGGEEDSMVAAAAGEGNMDELVSSAVSSTRRWGQIKTLGEARQLLSYLFETVVQAQTQTQTHTRTLTATATTTATTTTTTGNSLIPKFLPSPMAGGVDGGLHAGGGLKAGGGGRPASASTSTSTSTSSSLSASSRFGLTSKKPPVPLQAKKEAKKEEEEGEEEEEEEEEVYLSSSSSSSGDDSDSDDSEYVPDESPSRTHTRARKGRTKGEGGAGAGGGRGKRGGSGGSGGKAAGAGLEEEIDALLSDDGEEEGPDATKTHTYTSPPLCEPFQRCTVTQLKEYLKQHKLPVTGRKDVLIQRVREQEGKEMKGEAEMSAPSPTPVMSGGDDKAEEAPVASTPVPVPVPVPTSAPASTPAQQPQQQPQQQQQLAEQEQQPLLPSSSASSSSTSSSSTPTKALAKPRRVLEAFKSMISPKKTKKITTSTATTSTTTTTMGTPMAAKKEQSVAEALTDTTTDVTPRKPLQNVSNITKGGGGGGGFFSPSKLWGSPEPKKGQAQHKSINNINAGDGDGQGSKPQRLPFGAQQQQQKQPKEGIAHM